MVLTINQYPDSLQALRKQIQEAQKKYPGTEITKLAQRLVQGAVDLDMAKARGLGVNGRYSGVVRSSVQPPEYDHPYLKTAVWADNSQCPLQPGEQWHKGRRATRTGAVYGFDAQGRPLNPYMNTGLNGRGCLGQFGPNHAVDNGLVAIRDGKFYIIGITRKHDNDAPALSGGFAKYDRNYDLDPQTDMISRVEEFFEEMVSDSVQLLPEFSVRIPKGNLSDHEANDSRITALKLEQVRKYDPAFLQRIEDYLRGGVECFSGPVLADGRITNNAWIESRICWTFLDDKTWNGIKGDNKFNYQLSGGDDASSVVWHYFDPAIIRTAYASHGPLMGFMAASFLLHAQAHHQPLPQTVLKQVRAVADFLSPTHKGPGPALRL